MLVMMICCVTAVSATDINSTDDLPVDEVSEVIEDVEIDDVSDGVVEEQNLVTSTNEENVVTNDTFPLYFDNDGVLFNPVNDLEFQGTFDHMPFANFIIENDISLTFTNATFENVGFEIYTPDLTFNGATFNSYQNSNGGAVIYVEAEGVTVSNVKMNITAVSSDNVYAFYLNNASTSKLLNNNIWFYAPDTNSQKYKHVIRVVGGTNVEIKHNNITAYLPLKDVDFSQTYPSIYTDLVAGIAIQSSNYINVSYNKLEVNASARNGGYPTLDSLIIVQSTGAYIGHNIITEIDNVTLPGENDYLYAVDVYQCNNITIDSNVLTLRSVGGTYVTGTDNGTSTAYGIQLTGGHVGVVISNNNITTSNNGPNAGIYSQNYPGVTSLSITGNRINVSGNAGLHSWSLVTGMELGDDYAYVARNIINVINKAAYVSSHNAYGISYSQYAMRSPNFNVTNNTVSVKNGTYAVYIMSRGSVTNNCLNTTAYCGNNAVNPNSNVARSGNYCPLGSSCSCDSGCTCHSVNSVSNSFVDSRFADMAVHKSGAFI